MRRFHSYGPLDLKKHYGVARTELVDKCIQQLIGDEDIGHYFTIWAPRQRGKTWIMREAVRRIREEYGERFAVAHMSMQGVVLEESDPEEKFLESIPRLCQDTLGMEVPQAHSWDDWMGLFHQSGPLDRPLILLIDEFDNLPAHVIDRLVSLFRDIHLHRERYHLHGLALIGVRSVLGVSGRGSPFNVQRSLHVPNLTRDEVLLMFDDYRRESGQQIDAEVVERVFSETHGQPGLVGWFGELLTETYNPGMDQAISMKDWKGVYHRALKTIPNNTVMNLVKKARGEFRSRVLEVFSHSDIEFSFDKEWCNFLYLNGIIDIEETEDSKGDTQSYCRFAAPFIHRRLYLALSDDMAGDHSPIPALEVDDELSDVFLVEGLDIPALLGRYVQYLARLKAKGLNPWRDQPRRSDLSITEAVAHFHLYSWLSQVLHRHCSVSPEFPTGNGKVDLHIRYKDNRSIVEIKCHTFMADLPFYREQAAQYAKSLGLANVTLALFVPLLQEEIPSKLGGEHEFDGVRVVTVPLGFT